MIGKAGARWWAVAAGELWSRSINKVSRRTPRSEWKEDTCHCTWPRRRCRSLTASVYPTHRLARHPIGTGSAPCHVTTRGKGDASLSGQPFFSDRLVRAEPVNAGGCWHESKSNQPRRPSASTPISSICAVEWQRRTGMTKRWLGRRKTPVGYATSARLAPVQQSVSGRHKTNNETSPACRRPHSPWPP